MDGGQVSAQETVTAVEPAVTHMVQMLWEEYTIHLWCGCGWVATVSDPDGRDCIGQRRQYRAAQQLAATHQYPDTPVDDAAELWARLQDWPVTLR